MKLYNLYQTIILEEIAKAKLLTENMSTNDVDTILDGDPNREGMFFKVKINPEDYNFIKENQFLQLLNKDNNWVTFFVKSIIQDSAKKGYEKVLFPSGDTASKVEGHTTLEEFKKQKEDRIKELEKTNFGLKNKNTQNIPTQLEEGFGNYVTNRFKMYITCKL